MQQASKRPEVFFSLAIYLLSSYYSASVFRYSFISWQLRSTDGRLLFAATHTNPPPAPIHPLISRLAVEPRLSRPRLVRCILVSYNFAAPLRHDRPRVTSLGPLRCGRVLLLYIAALGLSTGRGLHPLQWPARPLSLVSSSHPSHELSCCPVVADACWIDSSQRDRVAFFFSTTRRHGLFVMKLVCD